MLRSEISPALLQKFAKDTGYPLHIFEEPYFSHQRRLYARIDPSIGLMWQEYLRAVEQCGGQENFFKASYDVSAAILNHINDSAGYKKFQEADFTNLPMIPKSGVNVYTTQYNNWRMLSVDLVRANFQALQFFGDDIHLGQSTWEDFVGRFTNVEYFKHARYLRQVTYGKLNIKKIANYERHLVYKYVLPMLVQLPIYQEAPEQYRILTTLSHDEAIAAFDPRYYFGSCMENVSDIAYDLWQRFNIETPVKTRILVFDLVPLGPMKSSFMRIPIYPAKPVDFYCVNKQWMCQAIRWYLKEEVQDLDRYFMHEGRLAKFIEPVIQIDEI